MLSQIFPPKLQLNKADSKVSILDLHLSISDYIVSTKLYDKRNDFDCEVVIFQISDCNVPHSTSNGVIFFNSSDLLERLALLLNSTLAINC